MKLIYRRWLTLAAVFLHQVQHSIYPWRFCLFPWARAQTYTFPLKQKSGKCWKGKDGVHSHAGHITPPCTGSSGIRSCQLKLRNQELNDCLHKVKFLKHRALKTEIKGAEGDQSAISSCSNASKHYFLTWNYFFSSYPGFTVKTQFQPCWNK